MSLLKFTKQGIYCEKAEVYIDPWRPVAKAVITHGHSDHARAGHQSYLCTPNTLPVLRQRLGQDISVQVLDYSRALKINGVEISFHPAGHIIGSAQVRLSDGKETWVVSGDYKLEDDGISEPFEPVPCTHFITESTFGLPIYHWQAQSQVFASINDWWRANQEEGKVSVISAYSLGKAQRILQNVDASLGPIFTHGAVENLNECLRNIGLPLRESTQVVPEQKKSDYKGALIIAPPSALGTSWMKRFQPYSTGVASGWMQLRGARRRQSVDRGFVLSDHADWPGLLSAVEQTGAEHVYATHGYSHIFSRYLQEQGLDAHVLETEFSAEAD